MFFFRNKKPSKKEVDMRTPLEVERAKRRTEVAAKRANQSSQKLNKLLLANGITLQIYHATGGEHERH